MTNLFRLSKKESKAQVVLNQYLRKTRMPGFFELKVAKGNTLNFSAIEDNQYEGLIAAENEGLVWKLSDEDRRKKPCDTLSIPPLSSYLVIKFGDTFYMLRIGIVVMLRKQGNKSISLNDAREFSEKIIHT